MKKRFLVTQLPRPNQPAPLAENEAHHAAKVLRLHDGETVEALDGKGHHAYATLRFHKGPARLEYLDPSKNLDLNPREGLEILPITLEMAVLKGEAMEWVIEKAVELGVQSFSPVLTAHTVVQLKNKGPKFFQDRWQKIADQALKQCGRLTRMEVYSPLSLEEIIQLNSSEIRFWCDESGKDEVPFLLTQLDSLPPEQRHSCHILIGPEGGWSQNERTLLGSGSAQSPTYRVSLGPSILRAETAALFTMSLIRGNQLQSQSL